MKVEVLSPITHNDKLHLAGETVEITAASAAILIERGIVKEVKPTKKSEASDSQ